MWCLLQQWQRAPPVGTGPQRLIQQTACTQSGTCLLTAVGSGAAQSMYQLCLGTWAAKYNKHKASKLARPNASLMGSTKADLK